MATVAVSKANRGIVTDAKSSILIGKTATELLMGAHSVIEWMPAK